MRLTFGFYCARFQYPAARVGSAFLLCWFGCVHRDHEHENEPITAVGLDAAHGGLGQLLSLVMVRKTPSQLAFTFS